MEVAMAAHVCLKCLGCICKSRIGTITDVEGYINLAKDIDILDHNLWSVVGQFHNDNAPAYRTKKNVER